MRFMVIVKANEKSEAGMLPSEQELADMAQFNAQLVHAGVLLAAEGLQATSKGARVRYRGAERTVVDGPFTGSNDLIAGFWLIQAKSKAEAIEWTKRVPFTEGEIEIRQVFELDDFAPGDAIEQHRRIGEQIVNA
jgi:hypothetical protein